MFQLSMIKHSGLRVATLSVVAALSFVSAATATNLNPGDCAGLGTTSCSGTVQNFSSFPAILLQDSGIQTVTGLNASNTVNWTAQFEQYVLQDSATKHLDFVYQVEVTAGPGAVGRLTTTDYTGFTTDVGYCDSCPLLIHPGITPSVAPDYITSDNGVVGFNFDVPKDKLSNGEETYDFVVKTNANYYDMASSSLIDGATANVASMGPVATPEPGSMLLLGSGLLGLGVLTRKRFVKQ